MISVEIFRINERKFFIISKAGAAHVVGSGIIDEAVKKT